MIAARGGMCNDPRTAEMAWRQDRDPGATIAKEVNILHIVLSVQPVEWLGNLNLPSSNLSHLLTIYNAMHQQDTPLSLWQLYTFMLDRADMRTSGLRLSSLADLFVFGPIPANADRDALPSRVGLNFRGKGYTWLLDNTNLMGNLSAMKGRWGKTDL